MVVVEGSMFTSEKGASTTLKLSNIMSGLRLYKLPFAVIRISTFGVMFDCGLYQKLEGHYYRTMYHGHNFNVKILGTLY